MKRNIITVIVSAFVAAVSLAGQEREVAIVAHRGNWNCEQAGYAKNSLAALKQAQEKGFWGSEFDVNLSADGKLLVFHDGVVSGRSIEKNPAALFASERLKNGESIPVLDSFLEQAVGFPETMLVFELKPHSSDAVEDKAVLASIEKLKEYGLFSPDRVMFISFSKHICIRFAELAPGFTVQYLGGNAKPDELARHKINGIDTRFSVLLANPGKYRSARRNGMSVNTWTVNKEEDVRKMVELGVDQITTDDPELVRRVLREMGVKEKTAR